jgi:hypothetical protein
LSLAHYYLNLLLAFVYNKQVAKFNSIRFNHLFLVCKQIEKNASKKRDRSCKDGQESQAEQKDPDLYSVKSSPALRSHVANPIRNAPQMKDLNNGNCTYTIIQD